MKYQLSNIHNFLSHAGTSMSLCSKLIDPFHFRVFRACFFYYPSECVISQGIVLLCAFPPSSAALHGYAGRSLRYPPISVSGSRGLACVSGVALAPLHKPSPFLIHRLLHVLLHALLALYPRCVVPCREFPALLVSVKIQLYRKSKESILVLEKRTKSISPSEPTAEAEDEIDGALLLDIVVRKGVAVLEVLCREDQTLLIRRDALLVLDLGLDRLDAVAGLDLEEVSLAGESADEDMHVLLLVGDWLVGERSGGESGDDIVMGLFPVKKESREEGRMATMLRNCAESSSAVRRHRGEDRTRGCSGRTKPRESPKPKRNRRVRDCN